MDKKFYTRKDVSDREIELDITIPADIFTKSYDALLDQQSKKTNIKGFRAGNTPKEMVEPAVKNALTYETLERIAPSYISQALVEEKIEIVAPPSYKEIPKILFGQPVKMTVVLTIMPKFKLGDMKKIKLVKKEVEAKKEEIDAAIEQMLSQGSKDPSIQESKKTDTTTKPSKKKPTDKWAKEIATKYQIPGVTDLATLRSELEKLFKKEKESIARRESEQSALAQAIKLSEIKIPEAAVEYEAHQREHDFTHRLEHANMTVEQFSKTNNVSLEEMQKMWKKDATEALETDVFLKLFAEAKKIGTSDKELTDEIERIRLSQKGKVENESIFDDPVWQNNIRQILVKRKAYTQFIEETVGPLPKPEAETPEQPKADKKAK